jgi:L,D-peptidoglycan transpeptidase YkuD (ErfK/YbiS/YcfS/YnhG family)
MDIKLTKKNILKIDEFQFKCSIGAKGLKKNKIEGDLSTPKGRYKLNNLFYRNDRKKKINCQLNTIKITKNMVWCDDPKSKYYNSLIKKNKKFKSEKLFRKDHLYDFFIEIDHNNKKKPFVGSAIFIHLTKNYKPTKGCIALKEKDFIILLKLIKKNSYLNIF